MVVITHYQRLLELHRARRGACDGQGQSREVRRQGAGARARSQGLCAICRRGGLSHECRSPQLKTPGRAGAWRGLCCGARHAAGQGRACGAARGCLPPIRTQRAAAPACRGMEIHRFARADARSLSAGRAAGRGGARAAKNAGKLLGGVDCRRLVFVDGAFVPECQICRRSRASPSARWPNALGKSDPLVAAHVGRTFATDDVAVALNTALMGDGAVIRVSAGAR